MDSLFGLYAKLTTPRPTLIVFDTTEFQEHDFPHFKAHAGFEQMFK